MRGKPLPFPKRVIYYGLLVALTLLVVEGMARVGYFVAFGEWYDGGYPVIDATTPPPQQSDTSRILHPFYGYTWPRHGYELNAMPPPDKRGDTVIVGLLGGSVAQEVTLHFQRALSRYFVDNDLTRRPVVLGMNFGAVKQPQQAIMVANTLLLGGHFDIIVNLDGYNEGHIVQNNFNKGVFPFFDSGRDKLGELTSAETLLVGRIGIARAEQSRWVRAATSHPLRYTAIYGIVSRYRWQRTARQIIQLNHDLAAAQSAYSLEKHGPVQLFQSAMDLNYAASRAWHRGSLLLSELAAVAGAEYYHFLQPNQYVPNSKPLTAEELACCYTAGGLQQWESYRDFYPDLVRFGKKLSELQINYFDLSYIFRGNNATLYRDECCHLNDHGNELLAAAMVERLGPALHRASAGERMVSGLAAAARPTPEAIPEELLIDADFQVYLRDGNRLAYVREGCEPEDIKAPFFLHISPYALDNLPGGRRDPGFENWDFQFERGGVILNGRCVVERQLPAYAIATIRTGQFIDGEGELWEREYRFER